MVLNQLELITREAGSGTRAIMERFLSERGLSPHISMAMSSNESIKQAVIANLGISFVSLHTVGLEVKYGEIVCWILMKHRSRAPGMWSPSTVATNLAPQKPFAILCSSTAQHCSMRCIRT